MSFWQIADGNGAIVDTLRPMATFAGFLQSTPGETVSKIELIARPSSKYDAEGVSGIINIRMKKNQNLGLNGALTGGYTQSTHARLRTGLNLNYRPGKINVFGNINVIEGAQSVG